MNKMGKENPASTGMDHGADQNRKVNVPKYYNTNLPPAMALCVSIVKCIKTEGRVETCEILAGALDEYALEMPMVAPLFGIMDHAAFCSDMATQNEAKAYFVAYFNRLTPKNKEAARAFVNRGAQ